VDLRYTDGEQAFRAELREWLAANLRDLPSVPAADDWPGRRAYDTHWQRLLNGANYAGIAWPAQFGGRGGTATEQLIFLEETERAGAPYIGVNFIGMLHGGPTVIAEGTDEQRARHLPGILSGDEVWCQGFSEPSAGSDLASLRTRAVRDGDEYVVSGQKIWTSHAMVADYCELLVRTDPDAPKHRGLTWLILRMDSPGVDIRPLRTLLGSTEFSEVFLDDVRVPVTNRVGAENDGWRVSMVTLGFERGTAWADRIVNSLKLIESLAAYARTADRHGVPAWGNSALRHDLAYLAAEFDGLWALTKRVVSEASRSGVPGLGGSIIKLRYTEARQRLMEVAARLFDRAALSREDITGLPNGAFAEERLNALSYTIVAGTSQVQRNIIAERALGLPKDR
jgi:alkylation response protein AidB-like acyl-CoA dehydrogenase